jgi:Fe-S-cluster containining protein
VNVKLETPKTEKDFDQILWYIMHKNTYVWIKKNKWYVRFDTKCNPLSKGICREYKRRPMLCREYDQNTCEKHATDEEYSFHTKKQLLSYLKKKKKPFYGFYE